MKFYFRRSPSAGKYQWRWPFIGIQFFTDSLTHIKLETYIKKELVYPLVLRPVAGLWLPGPRHVHMYLRALRKNYFTSMSIDDKCMSKDYSHRDEVSKYKVRTVNCAELHGAYPYIQRICDNQYCDEYFMLNNSTILYILQTNAGN